MARVRMSESLVLQPEQKCDYDHAQRQRLGVGEYRNRPPNADGSALVICREAVGNRCKGRTWLVAVGAGQFGAGANNLRMKGTQLNMN
jgi:hypothetical protein